MARKSLGKTRKVRRKTGKARRKTGKVRRRSGKTRRRNGRTRRRNGKTRRGRGGVRFGDNISRLRHKLGDLLNTKRHNPNLGPIAPANPEPIEPRAGRTAGGEEYKALVADKLKHLTATEQEDEDWLISEHDAGQRLASENRAKLATGY